MKYRVEIVETLRKVVEVDAETADDAQEMVEKQYRNCDIVLGYDEYDGVEFKVL